VPQHVGRPMHSRAAVHTPPVSVQLAALRASEPEREVERRRSADLMARADDATGLLRDALSDLTSVLATEPIVTEMAAVETHIVKKGHGR
jgi:hypothetical protein